MATLDILINARDNASSSLNDVGDSLDRLNRKTTGIDSAFSNLQKTVSVGVVGAVTAMGTALTATTAVIANGVGKAAELEQGVADIASVMGLATEEVAPLKDLIQELGMDPMLKVNATEASDAIMQLAQSGISMTDILDGAARNVVLLSNATGGDMALSAAIASDAMALFGISAADMGAAVNQITGVTVASKFGIQDYQYALAAVGGVASTLGVSFEDLNTTIAAISPSFATGSDAGTSLKTMLTRLIPSSDKAAEAMRQIGLFSGMTSDEMDRAKKEANKLREQIANLDPTSADYAKRSATLNQQLQNVNASMVAGRNAFFNADGSMKSMSEISGILQRALSGLSDEQRTATLNTIFGEDAIRAASAVAKTGSAEFDKLAASIGEVDAGGSAATRMNTFSGAMDVLQGVMDGLLIGIGDAFLPLLRSLVEMFTKIASSHGPEIIKMFREFADQLTATGRWLAEFMRTGNLLNNSIINVNPNIQRMASFVAGAIDPIRSIVQQIQNLLIEQGYWKDILIALGVVLAATVIPALVTLVATMAPVIAMAAAIVAAVRLLREAFESNFGGIRDFVQNVGSIIAITYNNIQNGTWSLQEGITMAFRGIVFQIQQYLPLWLSILSDWARAIWQWIVDATPTVVAKLGEWGGAIQAWLGRNLPGWIAKLGEWAGAIWRWIVDATPTVVAKLGEWWGAIQAWLGRNLPGWIAKLGEWAGAIWRWIVDATPTMVAKLGEWWGAIQAWLGRNLPGWIAKLGDWARAIWQWIVDATPTMVAKLGEWGGRLITWLGQNLPGWIAKLAEWATAIVAWIGESIPKAIKGITDFVQGMSKTGDSEGEKSFSQLVAEWVSALINWIKNDLIPQVGPKMLEFLAAFATAAVTIIAELARLGGTLAVSLIVALAQGLLNLAGIPVNLESLKQRMFTILNGAIDTVKGIATNIINAIATGITGGTAGVTAAVNAIWKIIVDAFSNRVNTAKNWMHTTFDGVKNAIYDKVSEIQTAATEVWNKIKDELQGKSLIDIGKNMIQGLSDGITAKLGELMNVGGSLDYIFRELLRWIRSFFDMKSPSRVMADIGENLMLGMEMGMVDNIPAVVAAARLMAAGVMGVANGMSLSPQMALSAATMSASANGNIVRPSVTNNATYNLSYQTMQSAESVQQDIELLNLLYGGQL